MNNVVLTKVATVAPETKTEAFDVKSELASIKDMVAEMINSLKQAKDVPGIPGQEDTEGKGRQGTYDGTYGESEEEKKVESVPGVPGTAEEKKSEEKKVEETSKEQSPDGGAGQYDGGYAAPVEPTKAEAEDDDEEHPEDCECKKCSEDDEKETPKKMQNTSLDLDALFGRSKVDVSESTKRMHEMLNREFGIDKLYPKQ